MIAALNTETTDWMTTEPQTYEATYMEYVQNRWLNSLAYLDCDPESKSAHKWFNAIVERYSHHDRVYHDTVRLYDQLQDLKVVCDSEKATRVMDAALTFAMFFQYYDFLPGHSYQVATCNAETAGLACQQLGVGIGSTEFIQACLRDSWSHFSVSYSQSHFHDAELSVLAEMPAKYDTYVDHLYLEATDWDDERWYLARNKWLERMLIRAQKNELYGTLTCRGALTRAAKSNMQREFAVNKRRLDTIVAVNSVPPSLTDPYWGPDMGDYTQGLKIGEHVTLDGVLHVWDGVELVEKKEEFVDHPF